MTKAKPRDSGAKWYALLFVAVVIVLVIAVGELKKSKDTAADQATLKADVIQTQTQIAIIEGTVQKLGIDVTNIVRTNPTRDEMNGAINTALKQPTAMCIWSEADGNGSMTVTCKNY